MAEEVGHYLRKLFVCRAVADAPAGHGIGLGYAVYEKGALFYILAQACNACKLHSVIDKLIIDLIGEDIEVVPDANVGYRLQLIFGIDHACGVGWIVEHEALGVLGYSRFELIRGDLEILVFAGLNDNRSTSHHADHFIIAYPERRRYYYLVTGIGDRCKSNINAVFCTAGYNDLSIIVINAAVGLQALGNCFTQGNYSGGGSILGLTLTDSGDRRHIDIIRSLKIRLARTEADNVKSVGFHLFCKTVNSHSC